ncbi:acetyl esterase [Tsuneonella dongtanensis]|uniref:Acetyl esterase n=2 Tax=Tsuneonella dongtanensis TaxID=692370 RepID=A0A1B2AD65_9SPHN|nr:acetyl esterase [Tsuneonella dongtanensis]
MTLIGLAALAGQGAIAVASSTGTSAPEPQKTGGIVYGFGATENGSMPLHLDLYAPQSPCTSPRPAVVFIHGGGFVERSNSGNAVPTIAAALAAEGIATLSIQYRLQGDRPAASPRYAKFPEDFRKADPDRFGARSAAAAAAAEDTVAAMNWLAVKGKEFCLDSGRVGLWGASAGAMTALNVAYALDDFGIDAPRPRAVVDYYGQLFLDGVMDLGEPPLLIVHGDADEVVSPSAATALAKSSAAAGIPFAHTTIRGGGHGFGPLGFFSIRPGGASMAQAHARFVARHMFDGTPDYVVQTLDR